jgi:hypothetical protein
VALTVIGGRLASTPLTVPVVAMVYILLDRGE